MKKTYFAPQMEIVEIKVQQMLAASNIEVPIADQDYSPELPVQAPGLNELLPGIPSFVFE